MIEHEEEDFLVGEQRWCSGCSSCCSLGIQSGHGAAPAPAPCTAGGAGPGQAGPDHRTADAAGPELSWCPARLYRPAGVAGRGGAWRGGGHILSVQWVDVLPLAPVLSRPGGALSRRDSRVRPRPVHRPRAGTAARVLGAAD